MKNDCKLRAGEFAILDRRISLRKICVPRVVLDDNDDDHDVNGNNDDVGTTTTTARRQGGLDLV